MQDNNVENSKNKEEKTVRDPNVQDLLLNGRKVTMNINNKVNSQRDTMATNAQKWWAAVLLGVLFLLLSSPIMYCLLNGLFYQLGNCTMGTSNATWLGLIVTAILFTLIVRLIMW